MKTKEQWIEDLQLLPHPEGGYYRQTDRVVDEEDETHVCYTNIYFLLTKESPSHLHQLVSDELWFYHAGDSLTVHAILPDGTYEQTKLGLGEGEKLHHLIKAGEIFGSSVEEGYALVSCTVIPGFDFKDFKLFTQEELIQRYPAHEEVIRKMAYERLPK